MTDTESQTQIMRVRDRYRDSDTEKESQDRYRESDTEMRVRDIYRESDTENESQDRYRESDTENESQDRYRELDAENESQGQIQGVRHREGESVTDTGRQTQRTRVRDRYSVRGR